MSRNYLPYIDGLRAIAVLSVIAFHINANWLPSGFVGVDMFFVISGFIVSYSISKNIHSRFFHYLADFYSRRIRRIFPALIVCVLITAIFSHLFIPGAWLSYVNYETGLFALIGLSNFILAKNDRDYFGPTTEFNPFTHTWSLGIEEQFYVIFPFLFYLWLSTKNNKKIAFTFIVLLFFTSLGISFYLSSKNDINAYFLLHSRFWELAFGVITFQTVYYLEKRQLFKPIIQHSNWLLFIAFLLVFLGIIYTPTENFPMPGALPIIIGTSLFIVTLYFQEDNHWCNNLFRLKPITYTGNISYSLYLWHWPILVLLRWTSGLTSALVICIAFALTFLMASLSYYFIEQPIRNNKKLKQISSTAIVILGISAIALSYKGYQYLQQKSHLLSKSIVTHQSQDWYPRGLDGGYHLAEPGFESCHIQHEEIKVDGQQIHRLTPVCANNEENHSLTIHAIGDSHTLSYSTLFLDLAIRTRTPIAVYPNAGCPFLNLSAEVDLERPACFAQNQAAIETLKKQVKPGDILFLSSLRLPHISSQWTYFGLNEEFLSEKADHSRQRAVKYAIEQLQPFTDNHISVIFEAPKPILPAPAYRCSDWFNKNNPICSNGLSIEKSLLETYRAPVISSMRKIQNTLEHIHIWDPFPMLCPNTECSAFLEGDIMFFDGDHISSKGSQRLSPYLADYLTPFLSTP